MPTSSKLIEIRPIEVKKWHEKSKEESFTSAIISPTKVGNALLNA